MTMPSNETLRVGFSPCPNDTYIFHALVHGRILPKTMRLAVTLQDVETLNRMAAEEILDITKLSAFAWLKHQARYRLLDSGAALGFGCGPLVVALPGRKHREMSRWRIALPGADTTAHLLFRLWAPHAEAHCFVPYDRVLPMLEQGRVDAGVIIHENRFTYERLGFQKVIDLGAWWEQQTGLPIPLGAIAAHTRVDPARRQAFETGIRESIRYAQRHPEASADYVRCHAQEMAEDVLQKHIAMYVNAFSLTLGDRGRKALQRLESMARERGVLQ
jgi:1,4-dihydroxy-6-naphthoate synthase